MTIYRQTTWCSKHFSNIVVFGCHLHGVNYVLKLLKSMSKSLEHKFSLTHTRTNVHTNAGNCQSKDSEVSNVFADVDCFKPNFNTLVLILFFFRVHFSHFIIVRLKGNLNYMNCSGFSKSKYSIELVYVQCTCVMRKKTPISILYIWYHI